MRKNMVSLKILVSTTVGGNAEVEQTALNTFKIWQMLELGVPVISGVEGNLGDITICKR